MNQAAGKASLRRFTTLDLLTFVVIVCAIAMYLLPIKGFSDNYDEGVYWESLRAMSQGHPLFTSVFSSQGPLFLPSIYPFYALLGQTIAAARIGVVFYALIGLLAMAWLGRMLGGKWVSFVAVALLAVDPLFALQAHTLEADGPAVGVEILAVALGVAASRRVGRIQVVLTALSGAVVAVAALMKLTEIIAVVPIALYLCLPLWRSFIDRDGGLRRPSKTGVQIGLRAVGHDLLLFVAGMIIGLGVSLAPFVNALTDVWNQAVAFHLTAAHTQSASLAGNANILLAGSSWIGAPALLALLLALWRRDMRAIPPILWLVAAEFILIRQVPLFSHIAVLLIPCYALVASMGVLTIQSENKSAPAASTMRTMRWLNWWPALALIVLVIFVGAAYTSASAAYGLARNQPKSNSKAELSAIQRYTQPGQTIITDNQYLAAQSGLYVPPELVDTSTVRITTGYLTTARIEQLATQDHIRVIVVEGKDGHFQYAPGFMTWLGKDWSKVASFNDGGGVFVAHS